MTSTLLFIVTFITLAILKSIFESIQMLKNPETENTCALYGRNM